MRILLDQGTPVPLSQALSSHTVSTAFLVLPTTSWPKIQAHLTEVIAAVDELLPGELRELSF